MNPAIDKKSLAELFKKLKLTKQSVVTSDMRQFCFAQITPKFTPDNPLSFQEMICMSLIAIGNSTEQCADMLGIKLKTVLKYEERTRKKLGAKHRSHALYLATVKRFLIVGH